MNKKIFSFFLMSLFLASFLAPFAVAAEGTEAWWEWDYDNGDIGVFSEVQWGPLQQAMEFLGLGTSWAQLVVILAACLIIFAAAYDILNFTAFTTKWVRYAIAIGITAVALVSRAIHWFAGVLVGVMGGSIVAATLVALGIGILMFWLGSIVKGHQEIKNIRHTARVARAGNEIVGAGVGTAATMGTAAAAAGTQAANNP